jgi:archaellin
VKGRDALLRRRRALGTVGIIVVGVIVIAVAAAAAIELAGTRTTNTTTLGPITAGARAIDAKGNYVSNATLKIGDELKLSVTVTNGSDPIAVHMVYNGNVYPDHPWNVNATHYNYIIDSGPADQTDLGVNAAYAVVSFQDGTLLRTNNVTLTVTR